MSSVLEVLGLSLPYSSSTPATFDGAFIRCMQFLTFGSRFEEKLKECKRAAGYLKKLLEHDIKPRYARFLEPSITEFERGSYSNTATSSRGTHS